MFKVRQASWRGGAGVCTGNKDTEVLVTGVEKPRGLERDLFRESEQGLTERKMGGWDGVLRSHDNDKVHSK